MSLRREVNQPELEREEDCYEEPATREDMPITIVEEEYSYKVYAATTTTSDYGTVGGDNRNKQGLIDYPPDGVDSSFTAINKDTDRMFVRAMASAQEGNKIHWHHWPVLKRVTRSTGTIGPGWSSGTFQPPTHSQDWVQRSHHDARETLLESPAAGETGHKVFSRPFRTYRNRRQLYLSCSTDCTRDLPARCYGLIKMLPDVLKISVLASGGRGIIGSDEKTTWSTAGMPRSPVPEVAGQLFHACSHHTGGPD